jgi:drug/metabolite transporter (DMT)-like permease
MKKSGFLIIASYLLVYIVWGSTYYFIKVAVETIPPFLVVGLRFMLAGLTFLLVCRLTGRLNRLPNRQELFSAALLGSLLLLGGNGLVTIAEKRVDSYLAALIITSTPLAVAIINRILFGIRPSRMVTAGIVLGIAGIAIVLYDGSSLTGLFNPNVVLLVVALTLWSLATCLGHRLRHYPDVFASSGLQMLFVGLVCLSGQAVFAPASFARLAEASPGSLFAVLYLASAGGITFAAFNYLLMHEPAQRISSYALVNPAIAVLIGLLIGKETPQPYLLLGLPILSSGIGLLLYGDLLVKKFRLPARFRPLSEPVEAEAVD